MSIDRRTKQRKDAARARKAMSKSPDVLARMLAQSFRPDGGRHGPSLRKVAEQMDKRKKWLGTSLLKMLVGLGLVRPAGDGYTLTRPGARMLEDYLARQAARNARAIVGPAGSAPAETPVSIHETPTQ